MLEERQPELPSPGSEAVQVLSWKVSCVTHLSSRENKCTSLSGSSTVHSGNSLLIGIKQLSRDERTQNKSGTGICLHVNIGTWF